jgi:hypothetical protein
VDPVRDLARIEPWEESLERSRARRETSRRSSRPPRRARRSERRVVAERRVVETAVVQRSEPRAAQPASPRRTATKRRRTGLRKVTLSRRLVKGAGSGMALALTVAILPGALAGQGTRAPAGAARAHAGSAQTDGGPLATHGLVSRPVWSRGSQTCGPTSESTGYVNPLAGARVTPERIDQGVDYAGSGNLRAIGAATVTHVATSATGWPGAFIEYRLLEGPNAGCYVYYAEGVTPAAHLHIGQRVSAGEPIASIIPGWATGIELGWGAGGNAVTYAAKTHQWSANSDQGSHASAAGKTFSALIASLGGPPGKVEG